MTNENLPPLSAKPTGYTYPQMGSIVYYRRDEVTIPEQSPYIPAIIVGRDFEDSSIVDLVAFSLEIPGQSLEKITRGPGLGQWMIDPFNGSVARDYPNSQADLATEPAQDLCPSCGTPIEEPTSLTACVHCGNTLPEGFWGSDPF